MVSHLGIKGMKVLFCNGQNSLVIIIFFSGEFDEAGGVELYTQVLYNLLHMIGKDADRNGQFEMIEHLRKAFHIEPKEHLEIYNQVCQVLFWRFSQFRIFSKIDIIILVFKGKYISC